MDHRNIVGEGMSGLLADLPPQALKCAIEVSDDWRLIPGQRGRTVQYPSPPTTGTI